MDKWIYNPYLNASEPDNDSLKLPVVLPQPLQLYPIPHTPATPIPDVHMRALERMNRVNVLASVMAAEAGIAKQWLNYRYPDERNIRIDFRAESRERGRFARGEQFHATLEVNIW